MENDKVQTEGLFRVEGFVFVFVDNVVTIVVGIVVVVILVVAAVDAFFRWSCFLQT